MVVSVADQTGADPTGCTDSSAAAMAAIATGKTVVFPDGTWKILNELALANAKQRIIVDGVIDITGMTSPGHAGVQDGVNSAACFYVTAPNVKVGGWGRITGAISSGGVNLNGIIYNGAAVPRVKDIEIDSLYSGITAGGGTTDLVDEGTRIHNCSHNKKIGFDSGPSPQVNRGTFRDCLSYSSTNDGMKLNQFAVDIQIEGGVYRDNTRDGIDMFVGGERVQMTGVLCWNNILNGADLKYSAGSGATNGWNRRVSIMGCRFRANGSGDGDGLSIQAVDADSFTTFPEDFILIGNTAEENVDPVGRGFHLNLSRGIVQGNTARANAGRGFFFKSCNDCDISGNHAWDNTEGFVFGLIAGAAPPKNTRITFTNNHGGDTRVGNARTQTYTFDIDHIEDSNLNNNIGTNSSGADWTITAAATNCTYADNRGTGQGAQAATILKELYLYTQLNFPSIAAGGQQDLDVTVTGADAASCIAEWCPQGSIEAGLVFNAWVNSANTVRVRYSNITAGAIDPAAKYGHVLVRQMGGV